MLNEGDPINFRYMPGISDQTYSIMGDINIGVLTGIKLPSGAQCSNTIFPSSYTVDMTEAIAFAVDRVNRDPNLLPNITLGFVIRDTCFIPKTALASSLSFLPRTQKKCYNNTMCYTQAMLDTDPRYVSRDVIGVLAPISSKSTVPISLLYSVAQLPMVGFTTTSDELSDKFDHPYFFRVVQPDQYSVRAMLKFISSNGWSYISMLYSVGSYGERAFDNMKDNVAQYGICIATSHRIQSYTDLGAIVSDLLLNSRARVVVLYIRETTFARILQLVVDRNATGHFVWIGADAVALHTEQKYKGIDFDPGLGTFTFDLNKKPVPDYVAYLRRQTYSTTRNPWFKNLWEYFFNCSIADGTCDLNANLVETENYAPHRAISLRVEAVLALAHAAHDLITDTCPHKTGADARACINGELLREYLKNTSFTGYSGQIRFDENHDMRGKSIISQLVYDYDYNDPFAFQSTTNKSVEKRTFLKPIGHYDVATDTVSIYDQDSISWSHVNSLPRIVPVDKSATSQGIPESVCSRPCVVGEYKIEKELRCCWECLRCRDNERITGGKETSCEACPVFQWPDTATGSTTCAFIPLTYPRITESLPIVLTCTAIAAILFTVSIFVGYIVYRHERVVKAGSRELSLLQLVAIFAGYVTVIVFQTTPTDASCGAIYFLFCMSFAWLYAPLLVKAVRIYRIFRSSSKHNLRPRFVSPKSQLVMAAILIGVQVVLCATTYAVYKPRARRTQPIWGRKLVELSCDVTLPGLASFLTYNIVLVSLCSVFAFKTRKLPDNFNESKFTCMCVSTTLVIWLAFIPTYYTSDRTHVHGLLLSSALLINHSVALLFLFVPKLYAAIFLGPDASNANATGRFQPSASIFTSSSNRIAPAPHTSTGDSHNGTRLRF